MTSFFRVHLNRLDKDLYSKEEFIDRIDLKSIFMFYNGISDEELTEFNLGSKIRLLRTDELFIVNDIRVQVGYEELYIDINCNLLE